MLREGEVKFATHKQRLLQRVAGSRAEVIEASFVRRLTFGSREERYSRYLPLRAGIALLGCCSISRICSAGSSVDKSTLKAEVSRTIQKWNAKLLLVSC